MAAVFNNVKLINETNKILKVMTTSSLKNLNQDNIKYIIFHRNGICSAILDESLRAGELLIISRFLSLVFQNNLLSLSNLKNKDFVKLLSSLVSGLKYQKDNYYWITALGILSQGSIVEFFCQSEQIVQTFKNIFLDPHPEVMHLVKATVLSISHLLIKVLENCNSNSEYINFNILHDITRICCFIIVHLLTESGISGKEIQTITKFLYQFRNVIKPKPYEAKSNFLTKNEIMIILEKLNEDNIANCGKDGVNFIKHILPYLSYYLNERNVMQHLCESCCSILQKTADSKDCVRLMTIAGEIIYYGSKLSPRLLHDDANVKSVMAFMKVLPKSLPHSDARNILWWHILCSLSPSIFQNRFRTYFVPFIENILGQYLCSKKSDYKISEFTLMKGYLHLSQFANHVIINILDNINLKNDIFGKTSANSDILVPDYMHLCKLRNEMFTFDIISSEEYMGYLLRAVEIWIDILKYNQPKNFPKNDHYQIMKSNMLPLKRKFHSLSKGVFDVEKKLQKTPYPNKDHHIFSNSNVSNEKNMISLSSDEAEISLIPEKQILIPTKPLSTIKPVIKCTKTGPVTRQRVKQYIANAIQARSGGISISNDKIIEMKNILQFFKNNQINGEYVLKCDRVRKSFDDISKRLPLKKRKIDISSNSFSNDGSRDMQLESGRTENSTNSNFTTQGQNSDTSTALNTLKICLPTSQPPVVANKRHSYFLRRNAYNNNSATSDKNNLKACRKTRGFSKVPKSNVDFRVNVCQSSGKPNRKILTGNHNQTFSKKVELKIKFDLNSLSNVTNNLSGSELGNMVNTNDNETSRLIEKDKLK